MENFTFGHDKCHCKQKRTMTDHSIIRHSSPASFSRSVLQKQKHMDSERHGSYVHVSNAPKRSFWNKLICTQISYNHLAMFKQLPLQAVTARKSPLQQKQLRSSCAALDSTEISFPAPCVFNFQTSTLNLKYQSCSGATWYQKRSLEILRHKYAFETPVQHIRLFTLLLDPLIPITLWYTLECNSKPVLTNISK